MRLVSIFRASSTIWKPLPPEAMKTLIQNIYSFAELSPESQERALESLREAAGADPDALEFQSQEMLESLKSICEACNLRLTNYSFGAYDRSHDIRVSNYDLEDMEGPRALAWFLRVLLRHGYDRPRHFREMGFPGICGFTGVCYDEDIAETVWKYLLDGSTVREAFDGVSGKLCKMLESELEYLQSEDCIRETMDCDLEQFDAEGGLA
jgi:hypothetical protein